VVINVLQSTKQISILQKVGKLTLYQIMKYGLLLYYCKKSSDCKTNNIATVFLTINFWQPPQLPFFYRKKNCVFIFYSCRV